MWKSAQYFWHRRPKTANLLLHQNYSVIHSATNYRRLTWEGSVDSPANGNLACFSTGTISTSGSSLAWWAADHTNKSLFPQIIREGTTYAPWHVPRLTRCGCESEGHAEEARNWQLPRTIFCTCCASFAVWHNPWTKEDAQVDTLEDDHYIVIMRPH